MMSDLFVYSKDIGNLYYFLDLIYYDRPLLFLLNDESNNLYIVTVIETYPNEKWLLAPIDPSEMLKAARGDITGYEAFHNKDEIIFLGTLYNDVIETELKNHSTIHEEFFPMKTHCLENLEVIDELEKWAELKTYLPKFKKMQGSATREENLLDVRFSTEEKNNSVNISLLGSVLIILQSLSKIINDQMDKQRARTSLILARDTAWNAVAVEAGSFKIKLVNHPERIDGRYALTDNMISLLNLLESTSNEQTFLNQLSYQNIATIKLFNKLLVDLKNHNTNFDLNFMSIDNYLREVNIKQEQITTSLKLLSKKQKIVLNKYEVSGTLTAFAKNKKTFEILCNDGIAIKGILEEDLSKKEVSVNGPVKKFVIQEYEEQSYLHPKGKRIKELIDILR